MRQISLVALSATFAALCASAVSTSHAPTPFSNYQPILDRMPFGALPANFGQVVPEPSQAQDAAQIQAEQQKLAKQINMSCVNVTPDGTTAIGFTDLDAKPPVNYYLLVGATAGGWSVVAADYDEEWAQISKDGVTITLKLGKGLIDAPPVHAIAATAALTSSARPASPQSSSDTPEAAPAVPAPSFGAILRPSQPGVPPMPTLSALQIAEMEQRSEEIAKVRASGGDLKSYVERLRERKQQEKAAKEAAEQTAREELQSLAAKITEDELKKKERAMNLNLIEQGARPISNIELTPEEEQALVDKGVLAQ